MDSVEPMKNVRQKMKTLSAQIMFASESQAPVQLLPTALATQLATTVLAEDADAARQTLIVLPVTFARSPNAF